MAKKKVMIVDDSMIMRNVIKETLQDDPKITLTAAAANGEMAMKMLDMVKPDLILLDLEMPKMDGFEFMRSAKFKTQAKIIVLSSIAKPGSAESKKALQLGAKAVIDKPSGSVSKDLKERRGTELRSAIYRVLAI
jgi:chemotaxis response regulator CheB